MKLEIASIVARLEQYYSLSTATTAQIRYCTPGQAVVATRISFNYADGNLGD